MAVRAERGNRRGSGKIGFDWVDAPSGTLGREELRLLVTRLSRIPPGARAILLDWRAVAHLDFRAMAPLVARLVSLRRSGIEIRFAGLDPYVRAVLRFSLAEEESELIAGGVGDVGQSPAGVRRSRMEAIVPHLSAF